jgi:vacuolar-type H+-ATPase subunit I/STV1
MSDDTIVERPKPAHERYRTTLDEVAEGKRADRRSDAIQRAIEEEAEEIREYLDAKEALSFAKARQKLVRSTDFPPAWAWQMNAWIEAEEAEDTRSQSDEAAARSLLEELAADAAPRIRRLRYLYALRAGLEAAKTAGKGC